MKYLLIGLLLFPFIAKADLFGFQNGSYYDQNENLKYICFLDNSCIDSSNQVFTKQQLGLSIELVGAQVTPTPTPSPTPTEITFTPQWYAYQAIKAKCDSDDAAFQRQIDILVALHSNGAALNQNNETAAQIQVITGNRVAEQESCKQQLTNF